MPKPVRELMRLVHVEQVDLSKLSKTDLLISERLKTQYPDIYTELKTLIVQEV